MKSTLKFPWADRILVQQWFCSSTPNLLLRGYGPTFARTPFLSLPWPKVNFGSLKFVRGLRVGEFEARECPVE